MYYILGLILYFIGMGVVTKIDPSMSLGFAVFWPILIPIVLFFKFGEYLVLIGSYLVEIFIKLYKFF